MDADLARDWGIGAELGSFSQSRHLNEGDALRPILR